jgi:hypothetical protein
MVFRRAVDGARVLWIPAGPFRQHHYDTHWVEHKSTVTHVPGFAIDETEVTNRQMALFLNRTGVGRETDFVSCVPHGLVFEGRWSVAPGCEDLPALGVTGAGALAYADWVGGVIPELAEWQKAAGGPQGWTYPWGEEEPDGTRANFRATGPNMPTPVRSYEAGRSFYGAYDMAGNAYERVWVDRGGRRAPVMIRGGSWASPHPMNLKTMDLCMQDDRVAERTVGFRVVTRTGEGLPPRQVERLRLAQTWEDAVREAQERNVPILVTLHYDTCGQCDRMKVGVLADPAFIAYANEHFVVLAGQDPGDAGSQPHTPGPEDMCPYWQGLSCLEHQLNFLSVADLVGGFAISPGNYFVNPHVGDDAEPEERILVVERELPKWGGGTEKYLKEARNAQAALGVGISRSAWEKQKQND